MEPRAEAGAEQRMVTDDRASIDADGEAAGEADVGELARGCTVSGEPESDRGGARGPEHERRRAPAPCTPRLAPAAGDPGARDREAEEQRCRAAPRAAPGVRKSHQQQGRSDEQRRPETPL